MTNPTTDQIVERAMADSSVYKAMVKKEDYFWGTLFSDEARNGRLKDAQRAAEELGMNRDMISLGDFVSKNDIRLKKGLVVGCGNGRVERDFLKKNVCESFHGFDIAVDAIEEAKKLARQENLPLTYEVADFNFIKLPENEYDLVCTQTALHHVLYLEHLIEQLWLTIKPGGILWFEDFIGETQFQWTDQRLEIVNSIVECLPQELTFDNVNQRQMPKLASPVPGTLGSPFESIRSSEQIPLLEKWFFVEHKYEWASIIHHVTPPGVLESYLKNEDTKALFELLLFVDQLLLKHDVLPPVRAQIIFRPKPRDQVSM